MKNCEKALKEIVPVAEKAGILLQMELLNSKVDHRGYQGDHTAYGVEVMKGVASPRVKLLYDIYHMSCPMSDGSTYGNARRMSSSVGNTRMDARATMIHGHGRTA